MSETTDTMAHEPAPTPRSERRGANHPIAWLTAAVTVLVVVVVGVAGVAFGRSTNRVTASSTGTITVTGSGTIQGTPDTCSFTIGVSTLKGSAVAALDANNARMQQIENLLIEHGVLKKDLQTSNLDIYEQYSSSGAVIGWQVDDTLNVTVHNIKHAGEIIDTAAHEAGNDITFGGVSFSISNESALLAAARRQAMQNAMTEATQLAAGANAAVTGIVKVTDQENQPSAPVYPFYAEATASANHGVPLQAGRQPVNVLVTVVYSLS